VPSSSSDAASGDGGCSSPLKSNRNKRRNMAACSSKTLRNQTRRWPLDEGGTDNVAILARLVSGVECSFVGLDRMLFQSQVGLLLCWIPSRSEDEEAGTAGAVAGTRPASRKGEKKKSRNSAAAHDRAFTDLCALVLLASIALGTPSAVVNASPRFRSPHSARCNSRARIYCGGKSLASTS